MTTRRRRPPVPPPRGRSGRFGLLPPLAIGHISVKALQLRPDVDLLPQYAGEHAAICCAVEAREAATRVNAAAGLAPTSHEDSVAGREAEQLGLRRPPTAAGAAPHGFTPYDSSFAEASVNSIGIPSVSSSCDVVARSGAGATASRSTSPSASATATASGPWVAAASAGAADSTSVTSSSGKDGPTLSASGSISSASASSSGSSSVTTDSSSSESCSASSWCAGTPQYFDPGSVAFGQRLPL